MSPSNLSFEALLGWLRAAGITVGVDEVLRLQAVFARIDDDAGLPALERATVAVLAKSDKQRTVVREAFARWVADAATHVALGSTTPARLDPARPRTPHPTPPTAWRTVMAVFGLVALAAGAVIGTRACGSPLPEVGDASVADTSVVPTSTASPDAGTSPLTSTASAADAPLPVPKFTLGWAPHAPEPVNPWPAAVPRGLAALFAAGATLWLWRRRHQRRYPRPLAPPHNRGPFFLRLLGQREGQVSLLSAPEQDQIAFGVGRYTSEAPTRELDLTRSVRATARAGGEPRLHFLRERRHHRVWTWLDVTTQQPEAARLARDLDLVLSRAGLDHRRANFASLPNPLEDPDAGTLSPDQLEEGGQGALVLVFTDGRDLEYVLRSGAKRMEARALFRELSHWPRLALVDFGEGRVRRLLEDLDLTIIEPEDVPRFVLGGTARDATASDERDLAAWLGCSALGFAPQEDGALLELRNALQLGVSAWSLPELRARAGGGGRGLDWDLDARIEALRWLMQAEDPDGTAPLYQRAARFWRARLETEAERRAEQALDWPGSQAEARLDLARLWVELYLDPEPAIDGLYARYHAGLADPIRTVAARLRPRDLCDKTQAPLPWRLEQIHDPQRVKWLDEMGFLPAGELEDARINPPARLWFGVALFASLAMSLALTTLSALTDPPEPTSSAWPAGVRTVWGSNGWISVSSTTAYAFLAWPPDAAPVPTLRNSTGFEQVLTSSTGRWPRGTDYEVVLPLKWRIEPLPCVEDLPIGRLVRCGPRHARPIPDPPTSNGFALALIEAADGSENAAKRLVGNGYAHLAWVVDDVDEAVLDLPVLPTSVGDQLLVYARTAVTERVSNGLRATARNLAIFVDDRATAVVGQPKYPTNLGACAPPRQLAPDLVEHTCGTRVVDGVARRTKPGPTITAGPLAMVLYETGTSTAVSDVVAHRLLDQGAADIVYVASSARAANQAVAGAMRVAATAYAADRLTKAPPRAAPPAVVVVGDLELVEPPASRDVLLAQVRLTPSTFVARLQLMGWYSLDTLLAERGPAGQPSWPTALGRSEAWSEVHVVGPKTCANEEITDRFGLTWVYVCPGVFTMGAPNERPLHPVKISGFWLQKHEMSHRLGRELAASSKVKIQSRRSDDALPVTDIDWSEAKALCEVVGGRLPTEAEWEYAARGWKSTTYPWGDEAPNPDRAVFAQSFGTGSPDPVNSKPAGRGPFGALHQAGNVWEWVEDAYADYAAGLAIDPQTKSPVDRRVLRGSSFYDSAAGLRSADRNWFRPSDRNWNIGVRCVSGSRPQPLGP